MVTCPVDSGTGSSRITGGNPTIIGFYVPASSPVIGVSLSSIQFNLKVDSTISGTISCKYYESSSDVGTSSFTSLGSIDASTLGTTYTEETFSGDTVTLAEGNYIGIEYTASTSNVWMEVLNSSNSNSVFFQYGAGTVTPVTDRTPNWCYAGSASSSGTHFPPPPLVVRF
jgi:hypothetical protein